MKNAGLPKVTIEGRLTGDPELRYTNSNIPVASLTIAAGERRLNKQTNEWEDGDTTFLRCSVWRELAENVSASLSKGSAVIATGRLRERKYETREGEKRTAYELDVDTIAPTLDWGTTSFAKTGQGAGAPGGGWANPGTHGGPPQYGSTQGGGYAQPQGQSAWSQPAQQQQQPAQPAEQQQQFGGGFDDEQPF